jgi:outer membrane protein assembly factor BamA
MPRTRVFLHAGVILLCLAASPAIGQQFQPRTIQFRGDPEYSDQELMDALGLKKDAAMSSEDLNGYARRLMDSGVFDNVGYKFDGVDLVFTLTPDTTLYPVRLTNLPFLPGPALDAELHKRLPLYHGKVPSEGALLDGVRKAFEEMLAAEGVHATVAAVPSADPRERSKVTAIGFTIAAPPVRLGAIHVQGASMALLPQLRGMVAQIENPLFDSQNTPAHLEQRFVDFYQNQGFAAVDIRAVRSGAPVATADAILVPYSVTIQEGRPYRIGSIRMPPDALVSQEEADRIVASPGKHTMGEALETVLSLIDQRYKAKGYLDLVVSHTPAFNDAAGTVDYTIGIAPGPVYHLAYIRFDNVSDDLRSRLMYQWQLMPGDPFNQGYLDSFLANAEKRDSALQRYLAGTLSTYETSADPVTHGVNVVFHLEKP